MRSLVQVVAKHISIYRHDCMTQRCLSVRLKEHATRLSSSTVGEHFFECEHAQYLASLQNQFTLLNDLPLPSDNLSPIEILVLNNYKILHSTKSNNYNMLAYLEALYLLNTTNPSSTLVLRPVKNYNFSRNYSNVVLLVGSFFVI